MLPRPVSAAPAPPTSLTGVSAGRALLRAGAAPTPRPLHQALWLHLDVFPALGEALAALGLWCGQGADARAKGEG